MQVLNVRVTGSKRRVTDSLERQLDEASKEVDGLYMAALDMVKPYDLLPNEEMTVVITVRDHQLLIDLSKRTAHFPAYALEKGERIVFDSLDKYEAYCDEQNKGPVAAEDQPDEEEEAEETEEEAAEEPAADAPSTETTQEIDPKLQEEKVAESRKATKKKAKKK